MVESHVRPMKEEDFEAVKKIKEANTLEYSESLRKTGPEKYPAEVRENRHWGTVKPDLFDFHLKSGSGFVAEANGEFVDFVFSRIVQFMHGERRIL